MIGCEAYHDGAKFNTDGAFHGGKGTGEWRPEVGGGLDARGDGVGAGGGGWPAVGTVQGCASGSAAAVIFDFED
jgi:hypothetical protein